MPYPGSKRAMLTGCWSAWVGNAVTRLAAYYSEYNHLTKLKLTRKGAIQMQVTKRCVVLFAIALAIACLPAMAARTTVQPILHTPIGLVYQAYPGNSTGLDLSFTGYVVPGTGADVITAVPGVLSIDPGISWANFVGAANAGSLGGFWNHFYTNGTNYQIKNVVLQKVTPSFIQCSEVYAPKTITQQGSTKIRTWWPLMYEAPGTVWTLTVLYGTPQYRDALGFHDYDDDGIGPNPTSSVHQDVWQWQVDVTFGSLSSLLALFHEIPFGLDEVPLISDEALYVALQGKIAGVVALLSQPSADNNAAASLLLGDFELEVQDACISASPALPFPGGAGTGTGIAMTDENPACCKLLVDVEYLSAKYGVFVTKK
jgi:hypothetical protein